MIELVLPIIKYGLAPLEVGPEFAPNYITNPFKDRSNLKIVNFNFEK